jgi:hypothetical protein
MDVTIMADRIVHFGTDACHRLLVLQDAGYAVNDCHSILELRSALEERHQTAAIVMTGSPGTVGRTAGRTAVRLARSCSHAPLILFRDGNDEGDKSEFDLVIPALTPPSEWLEAIATVIERCRALCADSKSLREPSALFLQHSRAVRQNSRDERERAVGDRLRMKDQMNDCLQNMPEEG